MKEVLKRVTASLMSGLMLCSSTCVVAGAASNEVQPRGMWAVYGDVNNDGKIDLYDVICIEQCLTEFKNSTAGATRMPMEYAKQQIGEFYLPVPQAADIDGDGYITDKDNQMIGYYILDVYEKAGRCGQPFYIN